MACFYYVLQKLNTLFTMKKIALNFALCASLFTIASCGNSAETDSKEVAKEQNEEKFDDTKIEGDTKFAVSAADAGMWEVEVGKLALKNGSAAEVKQFAQMMVDDHTAANNELMAAAQKKNITLPTTLSQDKQDKLNDMAKKAGHDFDVAYMDQMVDDHKKVLDMFKDEADKGNDADLKAWAAGKVATLESHLQMAENGKKSVKDKK
jgi:putative membrane protein